MLKKVLTDKRATVLGVKDETIFDIRHPDSLMGLELLPFLMIHGAPRINSYVSDLKMFKLIISNKKKNET